MKNQITHAEWVNPNTLAIKLTSESYRENLKPLDFKLCYVARIRNINFLVCWISNKRIELKRLKYSERKLDGNKMVGLILHRNITI